MNIIETIKKNYEEFSKSELKVTDFILGNPTAVEMSTITKIATDAKTSTSAVLRFCQTLGFNGYKDFRFEMIEYLHSNKKIPDQKVSPAIY
jgi:Transcriptional regulators